MTNNLQDLLDFLDEARMIHGLGQLDMTEMTRTLIHGLGTRFALELSIDRTKERVIETAIAWLDLVLLHRLGVENVADTHILYLLGRHQSKLNLLDRLERCARVGEM